MYVHHTLTAMATIGFSHFAIGQVLTTECELMETATLRADEDSEGDDFGLAVAISGDMVVVGARGDDEMAPGAGAAFVYRFVGTDWIEEAKLMAAGKDQTRSFGDVVAGSGDVVVVRSPKPGGLGSAYIFRFDGTAWAEEAVLAASDATPRAMFGESLSIRGDTAAIGAPANSLAGDAAGAAYVFRFSEGEWFEQSRLIASDATQFDQFGSSIATYGDVVVVGAKNEGHTDPFGPNGPGAAYVYRYDAEAEVWTEDAKLTAPDGEWWDQFGRSVAAYDDVILVGMPHDSDAGWHSGSVYAYRFNGAGWVAEEMLTASNAANGDLFGTSVSLSGHVAIIGAHNADGLAEDSGSAYVFQFDSASGSWIEQAQLFASAGVMSDKFGYSVSIDADMAVVGGSQFFEIGPDVAYVYQGLGDCNESWTPDACDIAYGISNDDNNNGIPDECEIAIVSSEPPDGAIDARQPSEPDGTNPAGWDSIAITFDADVTNLTPADFSIAVDPPGPAPVIAELLADGDTVTIMLSETVPLQAWTIVTHDPSGARVRIGYLPADANNDRLSYTNDVSFMIDALNGVVDPAPPAYQTDIDRSGMVNANDILRTIDLLNGAGVYGEYLGATLPE